jgi:hypothetical protein
MKAIKDQGHIYKIQNLFSEEYWPLTRISTIFVLELGRRSFEIIILPEESVCFFHIVIIV